MLREVFEWRRGGGVMFGLVVLSRIDGQRHWFVAGHALPSSVSVMRGRFSMGLHHIPVVIQQPNDI